MSDTFSKAQFNCFAVTSFLKYVCNFISFYMKYYKNVDPGETDNPLERNILHVTAKEKLFQRMLLNKTDFSFEN